MLAHEVERRDFDKMNSLGGKINYLLQVGNEGGKGNKNWDFKANLPHLKLILGIFGEAVATLSCKACLGSVP